MKAVRVFVISVALSIAPVAEAHVAPAEDANNRYIKFTPMSDRVRLVYTVFLGHVPGAALRRSMDTDRDRVISDEESRAYGEQMAARVAEALTLTVDGEIIPIAWSQVHVGMGSPQLDAGAFSVDLVTQICTGEGLVHRLSLLDRLDLEDPGETEIRIAESPGVRVTRSALGADSTAALFEIKWTGPGGPIATEGLYLDWTVSDDADPAGNDCAPSAHTDDPPVSSLSLPRLALLLGAIALLAATVFALRRRRRPGARSAN